MNNVVIVGAVALLGFLATTMSGRASGDEIVVNGNGGAGPPLPAPAPVLTATLNVEYK
jgi:hypothetical protein